MNTIIQNRIVMDCVPPEYREISAAFAREAPDWCFTVGEVRFSEEDSSFSFETWDRPEALFDGSVEKLSAMFCTVIFHCYFCEKGKPMPAQPAQVWCAGQNVTELTKEQRVSVKERAYLDYCRRFLQYDRGAGEGYAHKARITDTEEHGAVSWGENRFGEGEVYYWEGLKSLSCGDFHTAAARSDGRTVATGSNANGQCDVDAFRNADAIFCGRYHTAALKKVGTVLLASTDERFTQCATWRGLVGLRSIGDTVIGIKRDGNVLVDGDPMCPCSRDEIKEMFPELKLTFPAGFKSLSAKLSAEEKRKERAQEAAKNKKRRKAPASAVELDDAGRIPERSKKARPLKLEEQGITLTFQYADALRDLEKEFCQEPIALPYTAAEAAKYLDKNGVPPAGDNCPRVSEEETRQAMKEFFMVCRLCANRNFAGVIAENAAKSPAGKLIKNRTQRITTLRLTHGEDFFELCARNADAETIEIAIIPVECTLKNCRGLSKQPDSRAVLAENCSVQLD